MTRKKRVKPIKYHKDTFNYLMNKDKSLNFYKFCNTIKEINFDKVYSNADISFIYDNNGICIFDNPKNFNYLNWLSKAQQESFRKHSKITKGMIKRINRFMGLVDKVRKNIHICNITEHLY